MAWYEIAGSCGHTFRKQLYGKESKRLEYVEWANDRLECPDCYKARLERERSEANAKAAAQAKEENLPSLEGSEKQIAWAESIRMEKIRALRVAAGENAANVEIIEEIKKSANRVRTQTSAKWFIDYRETVYSTHFFQHKIEKRKILEAGKNIIG